MQTMTAQKENNEVWFTGTHVVTLLFGFVTFTVAMSLYNIKYAHVDTCGCMNIKVPTDCPAPPPLTHNYNAVLPILPPILSLHCIW